MDALALQNPTGCSRRWPLAPAARYRGNIPNGHGGSASTELTDLPDAELLERCCSGEPDAWKRLYTAHFAFVHGVARRLGAPPAELEDVCQEVFVIAFRKISSFKEGRLRTWLYRIAANVVSDQQRRRRARDVLVALFLANPLREANSPSWERELQSWEAETLVDEVLQRMSAKKREVFVLYEIEGLSGAQIAEWMGCRIETVWTRLHYARQDFERILHRRRPRLLEM